MLLEASQQVDNTTNTREAEFSLCSLVSVWCLQDLTDLKHRMLKWLSFWQLANWRQNSKPFLLLASAETTLGVRTILTMVKNRIWRWQRMAQQQLRRPAGISSEQQRHLQRALAQWQQLQAAHAGSAQSKGQADTFMQQMQQQLLQQQGTVSRLASGLTTLYQLGVETNQQMMQEVLGNHEVGYMVAIAVKKRVLHRLH